MTRDVLLSEAPWILALRVELCHILRVHTRHLGGILRHLPIEARWHGLSWILSLVEWLLHADRWSHALHHLLVEIELLSVWIHIEKRWVRMNVELKYYILN